MADDEAAISAAGPAPPAVERMSSRARGKQRMQEEAPDAHVDHVVHGMAAMAAPPTANEPSDA